MFLFVSDSQSCYAVLAYLCLLTIAGIKGVTPPFPPRTFLVKLLTQKESNVTVMSLLNSKLNNYLKKM